eukprot:CAMPEP_0119337812 /NCGR_PEP_ID=MMETSP1333-20130426/94767_1 /TAXON_ID=418940 /ORGANISM="Scyphosphaera apsteinii, Strain RCC1455" /LENGTH=117 /DNA_ID=CAMNT_0007348947 /DNA_START=333 /DNA_END=684 /DNA_ORIENTATION=+
MLNDCMLDEAESASSAAAAEMCRSCSAADVPVTAVAAFLLVDDGDDPSCSPGHGVCNCQCAASCLKRVIQAIRGASRHIPAPSELVPAAAEPAALLPPCSSLLLHVHLAALYFFQTA